jgi:hypothetical protein
MDGRRALEDVIAGQPRSWKWSDSADHERRPSKLIRSLSRASGTGPQGSADTLFRVDDFERGRTCRWGTVME